MNEFFVKKAEENKATLLQLCLRVVQNIIKITSLRIDKTSVGRGYRAVIFFERKDDK